jgi:hypothetical protein
MRLRAAQNKLKIEHSIIDGVRRLLERLLASNHEIRSVIPGVIRPVRSARKIRMPVPTQNGWKAIAFKRRRTAGAAHQYYAGKRRSGTSAKRPWSDLPSAALRWIERCGLVGGIPAKEHPTTPRTKGCKTPTDSPA